MEHTTLLGLDSMAHFSAIPFSCLYRYFLFYELFLIRVAVRVGFIKLSKQFFSYIINGKFACTTIVFVRFNKK